MTGTVATEPERILSIELHSEGVGAAAASLSPDVDTLPLPSSIPGRDPVPLDLAPGVEGLAPRFPLDEEGTWLVLYDSAPGELRAHWSLTRSEMERFHSSFPVNGSGPAPVLRLRRASPEGTTELVDEISLLRSVRERSGDASFRVGPDHCRYFAELGLAAGDGGWLMLARSNGLDNAIGIGLRLPVSGKGALPQEASLTQAAEPDSLGGRMSVAPVSGAADESGGDSVQDGLGSIPPPSPPAMPVDASLHAADPARSDSTRPFSGLLPQFPKVEPALCRSLAESSESSCRFESPAAGSVEADTPSLESAEIGSPGDVLRSMRPTRAEAPSIERPLQPHLRPPLVESETSATLVRIDPLTYGAAPTRVNGLRLEAELRILGEAAPGSMIDLLGHPFQVGPGGRFLLTLRVDDPDLLRRALELQPPRELKARRED